MGYKKIDGLMRHLRENGISISGSSQKRQLINTGYYHGYKGYRFFYQASHKLPFTSYDEVIATIQYDTKLKTLIYPKMMYLETALKNIALICILDECKSENIQDMYRKVISSYKNAPQNTPEKVKKEMQINKLNLQGMVHSSLTKAYKNKNPKITHFYNNMSYNDVPLWALFEIFTMGDFGFLLSCLTISVRENISREIGLNLSMDTNRELVYKYVYALKDLRNAIAHNDVIFDARFRKIEPTRPMRLCLQTEIKLPYINFKTIGDYIILICYYLKQLKVSKTEIKSFIREFEKISTDYQKYVDKSVSNIVIHPDLTSRIALLKKYI